MNQGGFDFMAFMPLIMIFIIFYFLLIRPQQKKLKEHQSMLAAIRRGDKIVTNGGLIGVVSKVNSDTELLVEIAENVKVRVAKAMVAEVMTKTEAVSVEQSNSASKAAEEKVAPAKKTTKSKPVSKKD